MDVTSSLRSLLPYGRRSIGINQLISKLETYLPPEQVERVQDSYDFAFQAHDGQRRRSGEPYITHPVAVADLLADLKLDAQTMTAAILHDVMEDTPNTQGEDHGALRSGGRRAGRRRQQARPGPVPQPRRGAGRKLPQDAARHGA